MPLKKEMLILFFLAVLVASAVAADRPTSVQSVPMGVDKVLVLNADGGDRVTIDFERPTGAREARFECFVRYTLILGRGETRTLTARLLDANSLRTSWPVKVQAIPSGRTNEGVGVGEVPLSADARPVLTDLGSCATGSAATDGARLVFSIDASKLPAGAAPMTVALSFD